VLWVYGSSVIGDENPGISGNIYFISQGKPVLLSEMINNILKTGGLPPIKRSISHKTAWTITLIERKSRVPQLQGVHGQSCSRLLRASGNAEDGVASAFPKGTQNKENLFKTITH
jgi:hypothetical protein